MLQTKMFFPSELFLSQNLYGDDFEVHPRSGASQQRTRENNKKTKEQNDMTERFERIPTPRACYYVSQKANLTNGCRPYRGTCLLRSAAALRAHINSVVRREVYATKGSVRSHAGLADLRARRV